MFCNNSTMNCASAVDRRNRRHRCRRLTTPSMLATPWGVIYDKELQKALRLHLLTPEMRWSLGYPMPIEDSTKALVFIHPPQRPTPLPMWNIDAPEFVPGSQELSWGYRDHVCARCRNVFRMTRDGQFLNTEPCVHHWGRMNAGHFTCCQSHRNARGCTTACFHVWCGTTPGVNGPLEGYVTARSPRGGVYAIDTEMVYTSAGVELASVAIVAVDGQLIYYSLVKPTHPVLDYNTRFSGIRPQELECATKKLRDVQMDIMKFVGKNTILIGHALENDLRALKLLHGAVIDTAALYPHERGLPMRRSLRALSEELLGRAVQQGSAGHSPLEDARAALDLVLLKVLGKP